MSADAIVGGLIVAGSAVALFACTFAYGLCRAAAKPAPDDLDAAVALGNAGRDFELWETEVRA